MGSLKTLFAGLQTVNETIMSLQGRVGPGSNCFQWSTWALNYRLIDKALRQTVTSFLNSGSRDLAFS